MSETVQTVNMTDAQLDELFAKSKKKVTVGRILVACGIVMGVLTFLTALPFLLFLGIVIAIAGFVVSSLGASAIKKFASENLVPSALNAVMENVHYDPKSRLNNSILRTDMGFPFSFDEIKGNDYIRGEYHGMQVEMSDVELVDVRVVHTKNGTHTERITVFKGPWIICDFGKELSCDLLLSERTALGKLAVVGGIKTESEEFNKRFFIRCPREHDAFYLLTPHMMERILEMDAKVQGDSYLRFQVNGKVILALNCSKNFFEADCSAANVAELRAKYEGEIRHLLNLLDTLRLAESMK